MTLYQFTVAGHGHFPFEMLSSDKCFPQELQDALYLGEDFQRLRPITLVSPFKPTIYRWASFLWPVEPDSIRRL